MDFHAYAEVYLGGQWLTTDARFHVPRIGRIKVSNEQQRRDHQRTVQTEAPYARGKTPPLMDVSPDQRWRASSSGVASS